ncbi:hypothetical protein L204_104732 [Cryptococcus depauperatus]|nr:hypothetical protein L204_03605 [Cryptococcus depauperatus CBS 7855]
MRQTLVLRATHYKPMIKFLGSRKNIPQSPHNPSPHPYAPKDVKDSFPNFLAKLKSGSSSINSSSTSPNGLVLRPEDEFKPTGKRVDFENFWEAPGYLWVPKEVTEREIEAVMSGGATDIRSKP